MVDFGNVKSTVKPAPMVVDENSVWIHTDITPVTESMGEDMEPFTGFSYNMKQYSKDEFIHLMAEQNTALESSVTDLQMALVELYEGGI